MDAGVLGSTLRIFLLVKEAPILQLCHLGQALKIFPILDFSQHFVAPNAGHSIPTELVDRRLGIPVCFKQRPTINGIQWHTSFLVATLQLYVRQRNGKKYCLQSIKELGSYLQLLGYISLFYRFILKINLQNNMANIHVSIIQTFVILSFSKVNKI